MRHRTALLFQNGNLVGREYYWALRAAGKTPDLIATVGDYKPRDAEIERARSGGEWNPPALPDDLDISHFDGVNDGSLGDWLRREAVDIAIQGGIGILKPDVLSCPSIGFVNVHPGRLPDYRGSCCPEWAIHNGDPVIATAHIIDEGIDTGPVICAAPYDFDPTWTYREFRANLYRHCGQVLCEALTRLDSVTAADAGRVVRKQDAGMACYRKAMSQSQMAAVIARFPIGGGTR